MVSGNPKGNSNLILPLQKQLSGQLCLEAAIVLGLGELFRCLFCCSPQEYQGCYMIRNNEVVDSYIVAAIITGQLYVCTHFLVTSVSHSSTKEQKHGTEILHKLNRTFWWNIWNRKYKDIKKNLI